MALVFSTRLLVHTHPEVSPLSNTVTTWDWIASSAADEGRVRSEFRTRSAKLFRQFPNGEQIVDAYCRGVVFFRRSSLLQAALWVIASVRRCDRVLFSPFHRGANRLLALIAYLTARVLDKPLYLYSEMWLLPEGRVHWWRRSSYLRVVRHSCRILVPAKVHQLFLEGHQVPSERIDVIDSIYAPRPVPRALLQWRSDSKRPGDTWRLLYIGRLIPLKGLDRLIPVVASLLQRGFPVYLTIQAGRPEQYMGRTPDYPARCVRLAQNLLPSGSYRFAEATADVDSVYAHHDLLIMPNRLLPKDKVPAEAWGRVVEEALLAGVPVISTDAVAAAHELIVDGLNGRIVPWDSDAQLEEVLASIMTTGRSCPLVHAAE